MTTYLGLSVIALWCLSVGLVNTWHAPIFFGIVAAVFGMIYYQIGRRAGRNWRSHGDNPCLERWGIYVALVYGLGLSLRKALKGGAHLYVGNENAWDDFFWNWIFAGMLVCLVVGLLRILTRLKSRDVSGNAFPKPSGIIWLVLIAQNLLAQVVTGPLWGPRASWNEFAFSLLYIILFILTGVIVFHYQWRSRVCREIGRGAS